MAEDGMGDQLGLWDAPRSAPHGRRPGRAGERPGRTPTRRGGATMDLRELWGIDDVANYLGVPKQTVYSWRKTGYGPTAIRVGKHLRWRASVVLEWTLAQERGH